MDLRDANVASELHKLKTHGAVLQLAPGATDAVLHISSLTVGEIQAGMEITHG